MSGCLATLWNISIVADLLLSTCEGLGKTDIALSSFCCMVMEPSKVFISN